MWMPAHTTLPPLATARSAAGTSSPAGAKISARVQLLGRRAERVAGPLGAERAGERLRLGVVGAGEGEHAPALVARHLADDVRGRPEAVEAEALGVPRQPQRPVPDQPRAQQRRGLEVGIVVRDREAEALVRHGQLGVAAVARVAREDRPVAQVLAARAAVAALAVHPAEPRHPHPVAGLEALAALHHAGHDLVPGHQRQLRLRQLAVHDVQVRAADAARAHLEEQLPGAALRLRQVAGLERARGLCQHHRAHRA